jgi:hypothetical protein
VILFHHSAFPVPSILTTQVECWNTWLESSSFRLRSRRGCGGASRRATAVVVRRYRRAPSPLVRDSVRGWRTGRIDLVLDGNFDVVGGAPEEASQSQA